MIHIDTRGKTVDEMVALLRQHDLLSPSAGRSPTSDFSSYYPERGLEYVKVVLVWLNDEKGRQLERDDQWQLKRAPAAVSFTIYNGKSWEPDPEDDLIGFVRTDGTVDWGWVWTAIKMS